MSDTLSQRGYAALRRKRGLPGGSLSAVQKAVKAGRITLTPDGRIDPVEADRAWLRNTDPPRGQTPRPPAPAPRSWHGRLLDLAYDAAPLIEGRSGAEAAAAIRAEVYAALDLLVDQVNASPHGMIDASDFLAELAAAEAALSAYGDSTESNQRHAGAGDDSAAPLPDAGERSGSAGPSRAPGPAVSVVETARARPDGREPGAPGGTAGAPRHGLRFYRGES